MPIGSVGPANQLSHRPAKQTQTYWLYEITLGAGTKRLILIALISQSRTEKYGTKDLRRHMPCDENS